MPPCDACGKENREQARFCGHCGQPLQVGAPEPAEKKGLHFNIPLLVSSNKLKAAGGWLVGLILGFVALAVAIGSLSKTPSDAVLSPEPEVSPDTPSVDFDFGGRILPNPNPSSVFTSYKRDSQARGVTFVQLRPVEDIVANFTRYEGKHVSLSLPIRGMDVAYLGSQEGMKFTWKNPRFGTYFFLCPIAEVVQDWGSGGWEWDPRTNTGSYLHMQGVIKELTPAATRMGMIVQIPTIHVYAIDDGYRFVAITQTQLTTRLAKAVLAEERQAAVQEKERDIKAAVMAISDIIERVNVDQYKLAAGKGLGSGFIIYVSADVWHSIPDRSGWLLAIVQKIKVICAENNLPPLVRVAVWDTEVGGLGAWHPTYGVTELR